MELFAYLQIAQDYEQFGADDSLDLADRLNDPQAALTWNRAVASLVSSAFLSQGKLAMLLAIAAAWSTGLSSTVLAVEEYNPGFRPGSTDASFVPVSPVAVTDRTTPVNCANALCQAACGDGTSTSLVPITRPTVVTRPAIVRPVINVTDSTFVAVRPTQPTGSGMFFRRGDVGPEVARIQDLLRSAGYFHAASTGFFATLTEEGVKAFQRDRGLGVDGIVGEETLTALQGYRPINPAPRPEPLPQPILNRLQIGDRGPDVVRLQIALTNVGFYRGPIDGVFAAATEQAVIAFQQTNGLAVSGIADPLTLARLGLTIDRVAAR